MINTLREAGFDQILILDGAECGYPDIASIILAVWTYTADDHCTSGSTRIHPYYPASQKAYQLASKIVEKYRDQGIALRNDIRLKPIFARLPGFSQGTNTLSYMEGAGSRFHVQILTSTNSLLPTDHLDQQPHELHCGNCRNCVKACPTNALEGGVFHRERCLRNWMLVGKAVPEELREKMGNRFLGCDICQRCCPHNPLPDSSTNNFSISLQDILTSPKEAAEALRPLIGNNLAIPNRVLAQACLNAACSGDKSYIPSLEKLCDHPSAVVTEHAVWALKHIRKK